MKMRMVISCVILLASASVARSGEVPVTNPVGQELGKVESLKGDAQEKQLGGFYSRRDWLEQELIERFKKSNDNEMKAAWAYLLGVERMEGAAKLLVTNIAMPVPFRANMRQHLWQQWPVCEAVVRMGSPCIPFLVENLASSDDEMTRELSVTAMHGIANWEVAALHLRQAMAGERDSKRESRLKAAISAVRANERARPDAGVKATTGAEEAARLMDPSKEEREQGMEKLLGEYAATGTKLREKLIEAIAGQKGEMLDYHSPLHCLLETVGELRVQGAEESLLAIADFKVDVRTMPVGLNVTGSYFYPAAAALVSMRVDRKAVVQAIRSAERPRQVRLLTWVLAERCGEEEAKEVLQRARKQGAGAENVEKALRLLEKPGELLSYQ